MHISILGLGLIGGSIGLALKKHPDKYRIVGYARRPSTGFKAIKMGAIDVYEGNPALAVREADIVIIATPILAIKEMLESISGSLTKGCIVSDAGSTKAQVMSWAKQVLPGGVNFIGGHPMAGKEKAGIEHADADLFRDCIYCLIPASGVSRKALLSMQAMVKDLGASAVLLEAGAHDRFVAAISHVPFIISCALFSTACDNADWEKIKALTSSGFRDSTRLASGDPAMYSDICRTNRENIKQWLKSFRKSLNNLEKALEHDDDDDKLHSFFQSTKRARDKWLGDRNSSNSCKEK